MDIAKSLKQRDAYRIAVADIYSTARVAGMTSTAINEAVRKARARFPRLPNWAASYVEGYEKALRDDLYANYLVFGGFINGTFYSTHSERDDYYGKHGIDALDWHNRAADRGHYWKACLRPYFTGGE